MNNFENADARTDEARMNCMNIVSPAEATKEVLKEEYDRKRINIPLDEETEIKETLYRLFIGGQIHLDESQLARVGEKVKAQIQKYEEMFGKEERAQ